MDKYSITHETWNKVAAAYKDKFMPIELYNETYDFFCNQVAMEGARILEIGCGPGNITHYIARKRPDFIIDATDVAPNMIQLAQELTPTANCWVMDSRNISKLTTNYDAIVCGFCLPYLSKEDFELMIQNFRKLLNENGVVYLSTIEGAYDNSGYEWSSDGAHQTYVYYYPEIYLSATLEENGFEVDTCFRIPYERNSNRQDIHLVMIYKKRTNNKQSNYYI